MLGGDLLLNNVRSELQNVKMIIKIIPLLLIMLKPVKCEVEKYAPKTIYVSNYCPKMKYCRDGAHVMCVYYDLKSLVGPRCVNYVNTKLTHEMVDRILESINAIRSKVASGTETGQDGELLPRAYGMMRVQWDNELATFAQVLANQCLGGREDECHATERFPNPSQSVSVIQFKYPDWMYLSQNTSVLGLNNEKILFAIEKFIKTSFSLKKTVSRSMIVNCPSAERLEDLKSKYYLNLIRGTTTHIGCGLSAYTKYNTDEKQSIYNRIELVCNFSDSPQPSQPLYMTDPPIPGTGFTDNCGCPRGYRETTNCLCEEDDDTIARPTAATTPALKDFINYETEKQEVITENYQAISVIPKKQTWTNVQSSDIAQSLDNLKTYSNQQEQRQQIGRQKSPQTCSNPNDNCGSDVVILPLFSIQDLPVDGSKVTNGENIKTRRYENSSLGRNLKQMQKYSGFSNDENKKTASGFKGKPSRNTKSTTRVRKIETKRFGSAVSSNEDINSLFNIKQDEPEFQSTDIIVGNPEHGPRVSKYKSVRNNKINSKGKFYDNKLMTVLEALEKEVHHVELNKIDKQKFDMKMRKIYKAVLSKNKGILLAHQTAQTFEKDFQGLQDIISRRPKVNYIDKKSRSNTYANHLKNMNKHFKQTFKEKKPPDLIPNKTYHNLLIRKKSENTQSTNYNPAEDKFLNTLRKNSYIDNLISNLEEQYKHTENDNDSIFKTGDDTDKSDHEASEKNYRTDEPEFETDNSDRETTEKNYKNNDNEFAPAERNQETLLAQDVDDEVGPSEKDEDEETRREVTPDEQTKSDESDSVVFRSSNRKFNYNNEGNRGINNFLDKKSNLDSAPKRFAYLSNPRRAQNIQTFRRLLEHSNNDHPMRSMLPSRGNIRLGTRR